MAYMDEMALEREKSKQAMIAGKQPLLGDDTSLTLHALGVNLGVVPPGTPPSQMTQLLEGLLKGPSAKSIHVDEAEAAAGAAAGRPGHLVAAAAAATRRQHRRNASAGRLRRAPRTRRCNRAAANRNGTSRRSADAHGAPGAPPAPGANRARLSGNVPLGKAN